MDRYLIEKKDGSPRVYRVCDIADFIKLTTWLSSDGHVIFRGQRRNLPLIPAIGRNQNQTEWFTNEKEVLEEFKRESLPYLKFTPSNDWQWLAVAQHNRLPTRLLDWTKNPLVALWFAVCKPSHKQEPGVVWGFIYEPHQAIYRTEDLTSPFSIDTTSLYFPEHVFPYIQAQSGVFTIHHKKLKENQFLPLEITNGNDLLLTRIDIPCECFPTFRYHLFRIGINPSTLFPGLRGLVERIIYENELGEDEGRNKP